MNGSKSCGSCGSQGSSVPSHQDPEMVAQDRLIAETLGRIKHPFIVMSGKGGVGKTSVSANLAIALSQGGARVGLMDVDLHGPDIPRMLGLEGLLEVDDNNRLLPKAYSPHLKVISVDSLTENQDDAVIWRGPLKMHVVRQFLSHVDWGNLDFLLIDCPPGTGDEPLSVVQTIPGTEAIIVTTPQEVSLADVRKSINFCKTVTLPVFGLIENMSGLVCPHCEAPMDLFGTGGGEKTALTMGIPFLGRIPFDPRMVECADNGESYLDRYPDGEVAQSYKAIAEKMDALR